MQPDLEKCAGNASEGWWKFRLVQPCEKENVVLHLLVLVYCQAGKPVVKYIEWNVRVTSRREKSLAVAPT